MIIVWTRAQDKIGLPFPDEADQGAPIFERWEQFAVMIVENLDRAAKDAGRLRDLFATAGGEWPAGFAPVADVADLLAR